eukprot:c5493_g1_i1 orf=177-425(+)
MDAFGMLVVGSARGVAIHNGMDVVHALVQAHMHRWLYLNTTLISSGPHTWGHEHALMLALDVVSQKIMEPIFPLWARTYGGM